MTDEWVEPDDSVYIGEPRTRDGWVMLVAAEVFREDGRKGCAFIARKIQGFEEAGNEKGVTTFREVARAYHSASLGPRGPTDGGAVFANT